MSNAISTAYRQQEFSKATVCHTGNKLVFTANDIAVFGGGSMRGYDPYAVDVWLNLSNATLRSHKWAFPQTWQSEDPITPPMIIDMRMEDGDAPNASVTAGWWAGLWSDLIAERTTRGLDRPLRVLVSCMGGHGRTGTILAALAEVAGVTPTETDPITWIRSVYCKEAIETTEQVGYLEATFGFKMSTPIASKPVLYPGRQFLSTFADAEDSSDDVPQSASLTFGKEVYGAITKDITYDASILMSDLSPGSTDKWGEMTYSEVLAVWNHEHGSHDVDCDPACKRMHPHLNKQNPLNIYWRGVKEVD